MAKILIVEDNPGLSRVLVTWLERQNYIIDLVETGEEALAALDKFTYDLLILDWELPGINGVRVCDSYRAKGGRFPVLFLTGKADTESKTTGLDIGADDYLTKPFAFAELNSRIKALLRRPAGFIPTALSVSGVSLELESRTVVVNNTRVVLTHREFSLLEFLLRHPDRFFSSKELLEAVWPSDSATSEDTVRSCMRALRKKITMEGRECLIKSVQGSGYIIKTES